MRISFVSHPTTTERAYFDAMRPWCRAAIAALLQERTISGVGDVVENPH